jgi:hypothetical protein
MGLIACVFVKFAEVAEAIFGRQLSDVQLEQRGLNPVVVHADGA